MRQPIRISWLCCYHPPPLSKARIGGLPRRWPIRGPFRGQFWAKSTRGPFVGLLGVIFGPFRGQFWAESTRGPFVGLLGAIFGPFRGQFWVESTRGPFRVHFWAQKRSSPSQVLAGTALRVSFESGTCWPGSCPPWRPLPPRPGCPGTAPRLWTWK